MAQSLYNSSNPLVRGGASEHDDRAAGATPQAARDRADRIAALRALTVPAGLVATLLGLAGVVAGTGALWVVWPNLGSGRQGFGMAAALLALGGLGTLATAPRLVPQAASVNDLRRRMAATARMLLVLAVPGFGLLILFLLAGRSGRVTASGWAAVQILLLPLALAGVLGVFAWLTPRSSEAVAPPAVRRRGGPVLLGTACLCVGLPVLFPTLGAMWPNRPLPADAEAAVAALRARMAWEQGWRFRVCRGFRWETFIAGHQAHHLLPEVESMAITEARVRDMAQRFLTAARDDERRLALIVRLVEDETLPVRLRTVVAAEAWRLQPMPDALVSALADTLLEPAVAEGADVTNWYGHVRNRAEARRDAVRDLRVAVLETAKAMSPVPPALHTAVAAAQWEPEIDVMARAALATMGPPRDATAVDAPR